MAARMWRASSRGSVAGALLSSAFRMLYLRQWRQPRGIACMYAHAEAKARKGGTRVQEAPLFVMQAVAGTRRM